MSPTRLLVRDSRSIETADLVLSPGSNFLVGANDSDKTSVLEAIYMLGHGRAFRSSQVGHVIRHEQKAFVLHRQLQGEEHEAAAGLTKDEQGGSKVRIDGTDGHKVVELAHLMSMQLIAPEGFALFNGDPKYRRASLDQGRFHNEPGFFTVWNNLKRLPKQRNATLRQVTRYEQLRPQDKGPIPLAEQISTWRAEHNAGTAADMTDTCKRFLPEFSLAFSFQHDWEKGAEYTEVLGHNSERDRQLIYTTRGPHKASSRIHAGGMSVEDTLSRRQFKPLMCVLRLAQGELLTRENRRRCPYLIDDFASKLDDECRGLSASRLRATRSQVFINAISAEHVIDVLGENPKMFTVEKGKITD